MILSNVWKFSRFSSQFALLIHQFFQCEILAWLVAEVRVLCHKQGYFVYETAPLKKPWYTEIMIQVIQKYNSFIDCSDWLPSGNSSILLWISAEAAASLTSTSEESTLPYAILYLIVSLNKTVSWGTTPMHWRNDLWLTCGKLRGSSQDKTHRKKLALHYLNSKSKSWSTWIKSLQYLRIINNSIVLKYLIVLYRHSVTAVIELSITTTSSFSLIRATLSFRGLFI